MGREGIAMLEFLKYVPGTVIGWAFFVTMAILAVFSGLAIYAWFSQDTLVLAGYEFGRPSIGEGAVVAYDLPSGNCPDGWMPFKEATSRFIIGAGDKSDADLLKYATASNLTIRGYREAEGEEQHSLTVAEMPQHRHEFQLNGDVLDNPDFFLGEVGTEYVFTPSKPDETLPRAKMGGERIKIAPNVN